MTYKRTHKERVMKAINHEETDRIPIDLGGTVNSSIVKEAYEELRNYLGMDPMCLIIFKLMFVEFFLVSIQV